MTGRALAAVVAVVALAGCGDDGTSAPEATGPRPTSGLDHTSPSTADLGGLPLEVPDGFVPIPVADAGFGLAVPEGFQVTLLTPEALDRIEGLGVSDEGFLAAARTAARTGAILYGAGIEPDGAVTDVKLDVQFVDDPDAALLTLTDEIGRNPDLADVEVSADAEAGEVRIRFTTEGPGASRAQGTQFLYRAPDAVWSLIVTSEDDATHDLVADAIGDSFVLADG